MITQKLRKLQRIGILSGISVALLVVAAHNPFDGYVTDVVMVTPPSPQCPHHTLDDLYKMTRQDTERDIQLEKQYCGGSQTAVLPFFRTGTATTQ